MPKHRIVTVYLIGLVVVATLAAPIVMTILWGHPFAAKTRVFKVVAYSGGTCIQQRFADGEPSIYSNNASVHFRDYFDKREHVFVGGLITVVECTPEEEPSSGSH